MDRTLAIFALGALALMLTVSGCQTGSAQQTAPSGRLVLTSSAFANGQAIPAKFTGDGQDVSPPLAWTGLPEGVRQLALICDDPDAPNQVWVHWVIYGIGPDAAALPEAVPRRPIVPVPAGAMQGLNSWRSTGYRGPKPPAGGGAHHYHFKLYALDTVLSLPPMATKSDLLKAMEGHILDEALLIGTYSR